LAKLYHLRFRFGRPFGLLGFDTAANGAVKRGNEAFFDITKLFVFRVNERTLAVLAGEDFIRHGLLYIDNIFAKKGPR
jgi:hypothetical protein